MQDNVKAIGTPTKSFFINMLTRDIDVNDAILDLLDNCLDGVVRMRKLEGMDKRSAGFYDGFEASIEITKNSFVITDNCGGIPLKEAKEHAFRMGRPDDAPSDEAETVGIYGIGMKRAIFKLGKAAIVESNTNENSFTVTIPQEWALQTDDWSFNIDLGEKKPDAVMGTTITITDLNDSIKAQWAEEGHRDIFVTTLIDHIRESYSLIIERGFSVKVNGIEITPYEVSFVFSNEKDGIKPFVYTRKIGNVNVRLAVGFYAPPPSIDESDRMAEKAGQRTSKDAGWTVICNDRVVLYNNKDHLTGWGENSVPKYHTQFTGIRGIVEFTSTSPQDLPMTTTKRGIDLSSPIYSEVKKKMCEGLKLFTNFTNNWKGTANKDTKYFSSSKQMKLDELLPIEEEKKVVDTSLPVKLTATRDGGKQFKPSLPKRKDTSGDIVYIRFSAKEKECRQVGQYLFDDEGVHEPSEVGEECYRYFLKKVKNNGEV